VLWNNVGGIGWTPEGSRKPFNVDEGGSDILNVEPEYWDWQIKFNLTSVFLCCKAVLPVMIAHGRGSIISSSSAASNARTENFHPYATAKGAIITLSKLIAKRYGPLGIRSNVIVPGIINSWDAERLAERAKDGKIPLGRIGRVEEVASAALFFASDDSSFVSGEDIWLDGGARLG
jgi:NAD(P)-dependent dehydrogenase (short-subunit alcohol dehydrogenase family)